MNLTLVGVTFFGVLIAVRVGFILARRRDKEVFVSEKWLQDNTYTSGKTGWDPWWTGQEERDDI